MEMSASAMRVLGSLLEARTGQKLNEARHWRIELALKPVLADYEIADYDLLAAKLCNSGSERLSGEVVDALLNNETYFFRDREAFVGLSDVLEGIAAKRVDSKRLRIWSAGCSTGQELYSIAIMLLERNERWRDWRIELLGTDISHAAIARARRGRFTHFEIQRGLPAQQMLRWFDQEGEQWVAKEALREKATFRQHNILDLPPPGPFDLVLCRNVLLYFPPPNRAAALDNIARVLAPHGALMLGAGETVLGYNDRYTYLPDARSLYCLKPREENPSALSA